MARKSEPRNRGQIVAKGERRWLVRFYAGRDADGKRLYPSRLVEGTFQQAEKELTKMLRENDTETFVMPSKLTIKDYCDTWLAGKINLSTKTRDGYHDRLRKDVYPSLGHHKLETLTGVKIQALYAHLVNGRKLGARTIEYTHTIFSQALENAVRQGLLVKNPAAYVELPKKSHTEQSVFDPTHASLFLEQSKGSHWHPLWVTLLTTGLRPGEALALQWGDLDLTLGTLRVQRALVEVKPGHYDVGEPKTKKSKRSMSLPPQTVAILEAHRKTLGAIGGWVFPNAVGGHYDLTAVRKAWVRDIKAVNETLKQGGVATRLPLIRLYDARHTHMTHLLSLGVHPKAASDRAGHSSINVTMNTYSHVLPEVDQEAGRKIGQLLFKVV